MQVYTLRINSSKFPVVVILCRKNFDQGNKHYIFKFKSAHIEHQDQEFQIKYSSHCQKQTGCSCIPYCSSVSSPGQSFFLEQRVVRSPLGDQHRTHTLQTSSSGRQQSFSGFFFDCIESVRTGDCTNIQPLYYFTITGMWLFLEIYGLSLISRWI